MNSTLLWELSCPYELGHGLKQIGKQCMPDSGSTARIHAVSFSQRTVSLIKEQCLSVKESWVSVVEELGRRNSMLCCAPHCQTLQPKSIVSFVNGLIEV